jgi:hypothetical protein
MDDQRSSSFPELAVDEDVDNHDTDVNIMIYHRTTGFMSTARSDVSISMTIVSKDFNTTHKLDVRSTLQCTVCIHHGLDNVFWRPKCWRMCSLRAPLPCCQVVSCMD